MSFNSAIKRFARGEDGTILVFWGISLAVILGIVALSFDLGRIGITQTELQSFADSVALTAAGELDGQSDSITRARAAAANLISDSQTFATGGSLLKGTGSYTLDFLSTLPADDQTAITATTTDPRKAIYARVVVNQRTVPLTFAAAFSALTGKTGPNNTVNASAVAGYTQYACDITPMMFCLPNPNYSAAANVGKMVLLRSGGNSSAWGPGDFGFLDISSLPVDDKGPCAGIKSAPQMTACMIAAVGNITQCFATRGVNTEPGQKVGLNNPAFNVRFDIYPSGNGQDKSDPNFAPAPNVLKGLVKNGSGAGNCITNNPNPSPNSVALPRDNCFATGTCASVGAGARFGNGDWSGGRSNYETMNYGLADPYGLPAGTTRYKYYLAEIAGHGGAGSTNPILTGRAETGRPMCAPKQDPDPDRRVIIAAGIDCSANPVNGNATNIPVKEFFKLFLTEPVGTDNSTSPPGFNIYAEVVGSAGGGGAGSSDPDGIFHDIVQLYR